MPSAPTNRISKLLPPEHQIPGRCVGTTTGLALNYIAKCITFPNQWHTIKDHVDKPLTNRELAIKIQLYVEQLGLKFFTFQASPPFSFTEFRVRCDIFES